MRDVTHPTSKLLLTTVCLALGQSLVADTFHYEDDFETDKAMSESWRHSPFVDEVPDVHLGGLLHYEPGYVGRGLGFYEGFLVDAYAHLAYEVLPPSAVATDGSVEFDLRSMFPFDGTMEFWGSADGTAWELLFFAEASMAWQHVQWPIAADDAVQFLEFRGYGQTTIDNLDVTIEYESAYALGDLNCDGLVNAFDIDPFVLALSDLAGYETAYPDCDYMLADINDDGVVNAFDIAPFVAILVGGP